MYQVEHTQHGIRVTHTTPNKHEAHIIYERLRITNHRPILITLA